jgi:hypothetical protein
LCKDEKQKPKGKVKSCSDYSKKFFAFIGSPFIKYCNFWNWIELMGLLLFYVGLILRLIPNNNETFLARRYFLIKEKKIYLSGLLLKGAYSVLM